MTQVASTGNNMSEDIFKDRRVRRRRSRINEPESTIACRRRRRDRRRHQCASDKEAWWLKINYVDKRFPTRQ